jgi:putative endonuclease
MAGRLSTTAGSDRLTKLAQVRTRGVMRMSSDKRFVYVLKNADQNPDFYVGLTSDVKARLADHNAGRCPHTASRQPWQLHIVMEFSDQRTAVCFERYLKSGSGRSFAKRHFEQ